MTPNAEHWLKRWSSAGLIDPATSARISDWERNQQTTQKFSGPVRLLIGLGGLTIAASILLFVAAHWDTLSPFARFMLVTSTVAAFHIGGGVMATRFPVLSTTLHAVGTAALGAGIFLAAQIFHLQEHWPGGIMLWAIGAWVGWFLLRDRPHVLWVAILTPAWLIGEWIVVAEHYPFGGIVAASGTLLLAVAYMASMRKGLRALGDAALLPLVWIAATSALWVPHHTDFAPAPLAMMLFGWVVAFLGPIALTWALNRSQLRAVALAGLWTAVMILIAQTYEAISLLFYLWLAVGSVSVIAWGLREVQRIWVNLGVFGFALTILVFYFSSLFDKLGRSMSLLVLGILLLAGGWILERVRKRLLTKLEGAV